ncbi:VapE domain-containing protein [Corynebacterium rouxii]|uniref:Virulence-associated protein E-like domain-containing protein n=1 Tax=Corynebacterium rouxii TaxID=2719119 RepID=A0A6I8MC55_9CORY|nr:VapE domain-containing protein [Corynebacterium rouxii]VZH85327.1 hypothetical protein FRC0190_01293 [Corynebacterium rouxii]
MNRELKISTAGSRLAMLWDNQLTDWPTLQQRLANSRPGTKTAAEYQALPKTKRDDEKDFGGFVGGHLANGRRRKNNILTRSLIALDADTPTHQTLTDLPTTLPYEWVCYSTHSHTADRPRFRIIAPLTRDVTADEYAAVCRRLAADIGIDAFDDTTYEAHRLMYWPTHPVDVEPLHKTNTGPWINPDEVLARYDDWRDMSTWPTSSRQTEHLKARADKQADPLTKPGLVGAFCRTYPISKAIEVFLHDTYTPTNTQGRYTYAPGESTSGVVIYGADSFSYSHHGTDPAGGQLVNAFDLVRLHKFGTWDDEAKQGTPTHKLPSYKAMLGLAREDHEVKALLDREADQKAAEDFGDLLGQGNKNDTQEPETQKPKESWRTTANLTRKNSGEYDDTLENLTKILTHDPLLQPIKYNLLSETICVDNDAKLPWTQTKTGWSDADVAQLKLYLEKAFGLYSGTKTAEALQIAAASRCYHPIRNYLNDLPAWDGEQRLDTLLIDYLGAENTEYIKAVTRKTFTAAVARVFHPGTKFDTVLILNGPQGTGKSTLFAKLAGAWFSDALSLTDMRDKTGAEKLQGYWILELGELAGMRKMDVETVKGFLSRTDDKFRAAYARTVESHPRQCIIVGSTNAENGFLRDNTGGRRFWPAKITGVSAKKSWELDQQTVDQIWAEALFRFKSGEQLHLTGAVAEEARQEQDAAIESDERAGLVEEYLDTPLPDGWASMSVRERRAYLSGADGDFAEFASHSGGAKRKFVSNAEIWAECFGRDPADMKPADSYAIASIMQKMPMWTKTRIVRKVPPYGKQRLYEFDVGEQPSF